MSTSQISSFFPTETDADVTNGSLDLERLLDLLPGALYICDREGRIVRYNRAAVDLWGRRPRLRDPIDRFCGAHRLHLPDGSPLAHADTPMADVLRTGVPVRNAEVVIERPDGTRILALVNIDPIIDAAGEITGAVNCFRDITEHRQQQESAYSAALRSHELLSLLPAAIYMTDAEGRITFYNEAAADLWGCRPELGKSEFCGSWRLFRPDGTPLPHDECPMAVALKEKRPIRGQDAVAERPDGTRVPFLPFPTPLFDASGNLVGAVNVLVDITERLEAEEAARRLASIVESSDDAIIGTDLDGIITSWNGGAQRIYGYTAEEAVGRPVIILIPDDRPDEEPSILERIRRGERVDHYETVRRRKDGSLVEVSLMASPIHNGAGRIIGASKIARDITDRRRAEDAARRLAFIVESSDDAIIGTDLDGTITSWNGGAQRLYGYTVEEVVGRPVMILIPDDRPDEEPTILERIRRGERVEHYETVRRRKDGSLVDVSLSVSPVHDGTGRIIGASKIARDITDRRRIDEQQQLLLREMNHRIKNLFALAIGIVSLSGRAAGAEEITNPIRERLSALARAHELTLQVFADAPARTTQLRALIEAILEPYRDGNSPTRFALEGADLPISGSALTGVALLVHEFATNAAKYGALSSPTGRIAIRCALDEDRVTILWQERDGPAIEQPPTEEGFGSSLARATVRQLGGALAREWSREGLVMRLSIPAERLGA